MRRFSFEIPSNGSHRFIVLKAHIQCGKPSPQTKLNRWLLTLELNYVSTQGRPGLPVIAVGCYFIAEVMANLEKV